MKLDVQLDRVLNLEIRLSKKFSISSRRKLRKPVSMSSASAKGEDVDGIVSEDQSNQFVSLLLENWSANNSIPAEIHGHSQPFL